MSELEDVLRTRSLWLVCHDHLPDDRLIAGRSDVAIRPSPRTRYDRLRKLLPEDGERHTSTVRRCHQTCARLRPDLEWTPQELLLGRDHGDWEGQTWDDVRSADPIRCESFWSDYARATAPHGESLGAVAERVDAFLLGLRNRDEWTHLVAVTHPEVIRALVCRVLQIPLNNALRLRVDPLSVTHLSRSWSGWQVDGLNHLP
jgi:alpha-ribazole phosphatase